ncbi:hypothetical protein [Chondromyces apiculatus]|uniref:Uncharacterized protein n=1 Tax=Chondromyces apiculatus DSM 436 TaxID=1192034 RepID=A0A017TCV2_9BACT|nr:hypothetical protein [Chondromyces apiculatus]EYF07103.1 Hypothetical protein CAP_0582 [Chondromyces apiculatus DSM 436]
MSQTSSTRCLDILDDMSVVLEEVSVVLEEVSVVLEEVSVVLWRASTAPGGSWQDHPVDPLNRRRQ